ncbi:MAG TPA: LUD domain-containing protein [Thermoplasmata archaeon]|nr:LUD domain-containing protein [Thermoplasmata archaeon]
MGLQDKVRKAVEGTAELEGMRRSFETILDRQRLNVGRLPDLDSRRERLRKLKERCVGDENLFSEAVASLEGNGCRVILVKDAESAIRAIQSEVSGNKLVVKSKSNITKELHLVQRLAELGVQVIETDLGDRIVQLAGCDAVHPTGPACHLTRAQISALLSEHFGRDISDDPDELTAAVKEEIAGYLDAATVGVTGANAITACEGAVVIVHNEGNAARCAMLPWKHIVVTTPEKVVPSLDDAMNVVKLQTFFSTGKVTTAYVNVISGPSYTADIEKKIFRGMHGPEEVVVIFVDGGRLAAGDPEPMYCIGCGSCVTRCPVYDVVGPVFGTSGHVGGQGVYLSAARDALSEAAEGGLHLCTSCGECREACPVDIDIRKGILNSRNELLEQNGEMLPEHATVTKSVRNYDNPWQMPRARRSRWAKGLDLPRTGEVLYFAGCSTSLLHPETARCAVRLLRAAGVEPAYLGTSESCCGSTAKKIGDVSLARDKVEACFDAFSSAGAKTVVVSCPGCYSALDSCDDLKKRHGVHVLHITEFLDARLANLPLAKLDLPGSFTYHDPCDLGRERGVFDAPRRLIEAVIGGPLLEMERSRTESRCCGAGSGVKSGFPELSGAIARTRIGHAESVGADTILTACPWCVQNLRDCQSDRESVKVIDLLELLDRALDTTPRE